MRAILVPPAQGLAGDPAFEAALFVSKRMSSHIRAMFMRPDPESSIPYLPAAIAAARFIRDAIEKQGRQAAETEKVRFDGYRSRYEIRDAPRDDRPDSCFASGSARSNRW